MRIIISESQYRLILENEEYIEQIKRLIETFDETNIDIALQIAESLKIKTSTILEDNKELFEIFNYKPSVINLKKIINRNSLEVKNALSKKQLEFILKLPKLKKLFFYKLNDGDLDDLVSTNKKIHILPKCEITSIPNLKEVGDFYYAHSKISLPKLKEVEKDLVLSFTDIESLPNLISVGRDLGLRETPLGKELKDSGMSENDIKNKFGVKGNLYI
jgi:hypothetical protein